MSFAKETLSKTCFFQPVRRIHSAVRGAARRALHPLREALVRLPDPRFVADGGRTLTQPFDRHLAELNEHGITRLSGRIAPHTLAMLQRDFESRFIEPLASNDGSTSNYRGDITLSDQYFNVEAGLYSSNEPFTISRGLLDVCLQPGIVALINGYLGKRAYITQGVALRIEPHGETGFGSFQWHHDAWGKRINLMIVLTEIGFGDQHMTYAKGSHRLRHSYEKYVNSRFTPDEFEKYCGKMEVLNCYAQPGDIYVFDSNGIHSGNRTNGRRRDVFILEYTRLAETVWAHRVPPEFLDGFSSSELEPMKWVLRQDRHSRPLAPPVNSWVDQLLRINKW
jgi:hypothetical protein